MTRRLLFALAYARRGWAVFPLAPDSKIPLRGGRGVHDATRDEAQITRWFRRWPSANVAIACGRVSGLLVLDVDTRNDGDLTLGRLERQFGPLPTTIRALTGNGTHLYFARPNCTAFRGVAGDGLDVKADGGYVVAPDSDHPSGATYRWDAGALPSETPLARAPDWLVKLVSRTGRNGYQGRETPVAPALDSFLGHAFAHAGLLGKPLEDGKFAVQCPWLHEHSKERDGRVRGDGGDSSCVLLPPTTRAQLGAWRCLHSHCASRTTENVLAVLPIASKAHAANAYPEGLAVAARRLARRRRMIREGST